jgi:hypothetical protein
LSFLESNIVFEVIERDEERLRLRVELSDELFVEDTGLAPAQRFEISLLVSREQMRKALSDCCWQMRMFPERPSHARACRPYGDKRTGCVVCGTS